MVPAMVPAMEFMDGEGEGLASSSSAASSWSWSSNARCCQWLSFVSACSAAVDCAPSSFSTSSKKDSVELAREERLLLRLLREATASGERLRRAKLEVDCEEEATPKAPSKVAESAGLVLGGGMAVSAAESWEMRSFASDCLVGSELGLRLGGGSLSGLLLRSCWSLAKMRLELRAISAPKRREDMEWASWSDDLRSAARGRGRVEPPRTGWRRSWWRLAAAAVDGLPTWMLSKRWGSASDGEGPRWARGATGAGEMSMSLGELIFAARLGERALREVPMAAPRELAGRGEMCEVGWW
jgi:hypothetical protein